MHGEDYSRRSFGRSRGNLPAPPPLPAGQKHAAAACGLRPAPRRLTPCVSPRPWKCAPTGAAAGRCVHGTYRCCRGIPGPWHSPGSCRSLPYQVHGTTQPFPGAAAGIPGPWHCAVLPRDGPHCGSSRCPFPSGTRRQKPAHCPEGCCRPGLPGDRPPTPPHPTAPRIAATTLCIAGDHHLLPLGHNAQVTIALESVLR